MKATILAAGAAILCGPAQAAPADPAPIVAAERAFSARAAEIGVNPSFLEFMTDQAFIFAPQPVNARAFYAGRPKAKTPKEGGALLAWWPNLAGMARSGDLGFTTGPATINGKPGVFYFTLWARQPDGGWKWIYDGGVGGVSPDAPGPDHPPAVLPPGDAKPIAPALAWRQVAEAEAALAGGGPGALKAVLADGARVQGSPKGPAATPAAIDAELATRPANLSYRLLGGGSSAAGDLVWTWGEAAGAKDTPHFVRVWQRRGGAWRVVFDQLV